MQHATIEASERKTSSSIRVFPVCETGYIMSFDLHARCESCLGPEHAGVTLTPQAACPYCKLLPAAERQRRADAFAPDAEEVFPVLDLYPLDDALDFFNTGTRFARSHRCGWINSSRQCNKGFSGYKEKGRSFAQPLRFTLTQAPAPEEVQVEIRIKSLDVIRKEKAARSLGQGQVHEAGWCGTKGPSPAKASATHPGAIHVNTSKLHLERKRKLARDEEEELMGRSEAPPKWEVPAKKAAVQPGEIRVKTLEEIRKEKAARMQTTVQEVKAEESPAPPSAPLKRRILRINRNMATGADSGSNTSARKERLATPSTTENGAVNGKTESLGEVGRVKTFQEMITEDISRSHSIAEQSSTSAEPLRVLAKDPPAALQSSSTMLKSYRQCTATPDTSGSASLTLDELLIEFADDMLVDEMELDSDMNGDDLLLQLLVMIDS